MQVIGIPPLFLFFFFALTHDFLVLQAIHRDYDSYTTWSRWQADRFDYMTSLRRKGVNVSDSPVIHSQNEMTTLYGQSPLATTARQQTATLTWTTVHTYWSQLMYSRIGITCCLSGALQVLHLILSIWPKRRMPAWLYLNNFEPFDCTCFLLIHPSLRPPPSHVTFNFCVAVCGVSLSKRIGRGND